MNSYEQMWLLTEKCNVEDSNPFLFPRAVKIAHSCPLYYQCSLGESWQSHSWYQEGRGVTNSCLHFLALISFTNLFPLLPAISYRVYIKGSMEAWLTRADCSIFKSAQVWLFMVPRCRGSCGVLVIMSLVYVVEQHSECGNNKHVRPWRCLVVIQFVFKAIVIYIDNCIS